MFHKEVLKAIGEGKKIKCKYLDRGEFKDIVYIDAITRIRNDILNGLKENTFLIIEEEKPVNAEEELQNKLSAALDASIDQFGKERLARTLVDKTDSYINFILDNNGKLDKQNGKYVAEISIVVSSKGDSPSECIEDLIVFRNAVKETIRNA